MAPGAVRPSRLQIRKSELREVKEVLQVGAISEARFLRYYHDALFIILKLSQSCFKESLFLDILGLGGH